MLASAIPASQAWEKLNFGIRMLGGIDLRAVALPFVFLTSSACPNLAFRRLQSMACGSMMSSCIVPGIGVVGVIRVELHQAHARQSALTDG